MRIHCFNHHIKVFNVLLCTTYYELEVSNMYDWGREERYSKENTVRGWAGDQYFWNLFLKILKLNLLNYFFEGIGLIHRRTGLHEQSNI